MNEQLDLFGFAPSQYIIKKPIRLIELFAGIGAQTKALDPIDRGKLDGLFYDIVSKENQYMELKSLDEIKISELPNEKLKCRKIIREEEKYDKN